MDHQSILFPLCLCLLSIPGRNDWHKPGQYPSEGIDVRLLEHISPIEWENVLLYGEYVIDRTRIRVA